MAKKQKTPGVKALRKLVDDTRAAREKLTQRAERAQARIAALGDNLAAAERQLADALEARAARAAAPAGDGGTAEVVTRPRTTTTRSTAAGAKTAKTPTRRTRTTSTAKAGTTPRARTTAKRATTPRAPRKTRTTPPTT